MAFLVKINGTSALVSKKSFGNTELRTVNVLIFVLPWVWFSDSLIVVTQKILSWDKFVLRQDINTASIIYNNPALFCNIRSSGIWSFCVGACMCTCVDCGEHGCGIGISCWLSCDQELSCCRCTRLCLYSFAVVFLETLFKEHLKLCRMPKTCGHVWNICFCCRFDLSCFFNMCLLFFQYFMY